MEGKKWIKYNYYHRLNHEIVIPAFKSINEMGQAERIKKCGVFVHEIDCCECGTEHYGGFEPCRNRWCFNCMHKRLTCWVAKLIPVFCDWYEKGNYVSMLNFTVRDGFPLAERVKFLDDSYRKMYNANKKRRDYWQERFPGGIRSLEVKLGKNSGEWHPHLHCLVMQEAGEYVKDYDWLSEDWHRIVGLKEYSGRLLCDGSAVVLAEETTRKDGSYDYNWNGNVFIKKVSRQGDKRRNPLNQGILGAVCETLKYIVKVDEHIESDATRNFYKDPVLFKEAYTALRGKRQTSTWGLLYGTQDEVDEAFEKESYQQLKNFICQRCGCTEGELNKVLYETVKEIMLYDVKSVNAKE